MQDRRSGSALIAYNIETGGAPARARHNHQLLSSHSMGMLLHPGTLLHGRRLHNCVLIFTV